MTRKLLFGLLPGVIGALVLAGCASDSEPKLPESEYSDMPWNTPRPGEGSGAFGGVFDQGR